LWQIPDGVNLLSPEYSLFMTRNGLNNPRDSIYHPSGQDRDLISDGQISGKDIPSLMITTSIIESETAPRLLINAKAKQ
jgi:hypothetical protein